MSDLGEMPARAEGVAITDNVGTLISQQRYLPFGQVRSDIGSITQTDLGYTGQRALDPGMGGLMDYHARFYDPYINHFTQPDTITPGGTQGLNRFSYAGNNPVNFNDPTGHRACGDGEDIDCNGKLNKTITNTKNCSGKSCMDDSSNDNSKKLITKHIGDFYVGPNLPKDLTEYEAEAYSEHGMSNTPAGPYSAFGNGYGLLDNGVDAYGRRRNQSNVFVSVNYEQFNDGSINVNSLTIANSSNLKIFITSVIFTATGNPIHQLVAHSCNNLDQCYIPNPPRLVDANGNNSEYFETIDPGSVEIVSLVPSSYPTNPNNHFGPQYIQTASIRVDFVPAIYPEAPFVTYDLFP